MTDASGGEKAFHHARINKADGTSNLAIYMDANTTLGVFNLFNSDYSVSNNIWSCGYYNNPYNLGIKTGIYSVVTTSSASIITASENTGPSLCFGIRGISSSSSYVIRLHSNKYFMSQISITISSAGNPIFSSMSYDMNGRIMSTINIHIAKFK